MKKLSKKNIEDIFALTPMQEGMLFHYLKNPKSDHYFEQLSLKITGEVNLEGFKKVWDYVVQGNEMLRTFFRWEKLDSPAQVVLKQHNPHLGFFDLSDIEDHAKQQKQLEKIKFEDRKEKFDLREVPFRVILCKISGKDYHIVISNHHILYDGWSSGIILKEFFRVYAGLEEGEKSLVLPVKPSFKEFVRWHQNRDKDKQKKFWEEYFKGFDTQTQLPIKRKSVKINKVPGGTPVKEFGFTLEKGISDRLDTFLKKHRITLAAFFYCSWGILLQKYCSSDDIVFGTTVSGRSAPINGIENMVGLFFNTIPLRVQTQSGEKTIDLIFQIKKALQQREEYENTPLVNIKEYSEVENNEELFDTIIAVENYPLDSKLIRENSKLSVISYSMFEMTHYDLSIRIGIPDEIEVNLSYNKNCYDEEIIENLLNHFTCIVKDITNNPGKKIPEIDMLTEEEKRQVLFNFNDTDAPYPKYTTIIERFEARVNKNPDRTALVSPNKCLTYSELNKRANCVGHVLRGKGVGPNRIVGLLKERSIEMMVGILGILKAGGAYLPIEPGYPQERIRYMLEDSDSRLLLTMAQHAKPIVFPGDVIDVEEIAYQKERRNLDVVNSPDDLVYMIYTSGSTGKPKGVMVKIDGFFNLLHWYTEEFEINETDNVLLIAPISFDLAQKNLFAPHIIGGCLSLASPGLTDYHELSDYIAKEQITIINCAPSVFYPLIEFNSDPGFTRLKFLRYVFLGGEPIQAGKLLPWMNSGSYNCEIVNTYGPTECTDIATFYRIPREDIIQQKMIPIGKPINNVKLFILDKNQNILPVGSPGELCIGGLSLSGGYHKNSHLTREKFIETSHLPEKIVYCTGDLVRWLPDGNIEFLGRLDHQVKIRGVRIELGEIESELLIHDAIKETVVIIKESETGNNYLCAYIVSGETFDLTSAKPADKPKGINVSDLKKYLSKTLPDYMIPNYFVKLDRIPLTPSGKVDRRALPEPEFGESGSAAAYVAPRNEIENKLVEIWAEVLGILKESRQPLIGINDNFFELGGHSLKVAGLIGRIHKKLNIEVPFNKIFQAPTVKDLAQYIGQKEESQYSEIPPLEEKEYYPLSSAQKRLFVLQQMEVECTAYNIWGIMDVEGPVEKEKFGLVFRQLISRHESFRTSFQMVEEQPVQNIHDEVILVIGHRSLVIGEEESIEAIIQDFIRPFDLSHAPLLRVGLTEVEEEKHLLMVDMHHIISDGMSTELLVQDFMALYSEEELPVMRLQYKDFSEWHNREAQREAQIKQKAYWKKQLGGEIPVLDLPGDYVRPTIQRFEGSTVAFEIDQEEVNALQSLALAEGMTVYMILLSIYYILLSKLSNQEDILVGTPTAGRRHADLQQIIGMFVNTLVLRNYPTGDKTYRGFLKEIKKRSLQAFENQDYPYEELVEEVAITRDASRNPLFDTMFVMQNIGIPRIDTPDLKLTPAEHQLETSKFDLTLIGKEVEEKLLLIFEYSTNLFKKAAIERFATYLKKIVSSVVDNPDVKICDLEVLLEEEKRQVLYDFNNTTADYPKDKVIHELFAEQAEMSPDRTAVIGPLLSARRTAPSYRRPTGDALQGAFSYRKLNKISDELAYFLKEKGVGPDTIVGIMVERSIEMVGGIMGILKAGGAYLPIDADYPEDRVKFMLADSNVRILLSGVSEWSKVKGWSKESERTGGTGGIEGIEVIGIGDVHMPALLYHHSFQEGSDVVMASVDSLAYVLYTSGSTGRPKGVAVQHGSVVNILVALFKKYPLLKEDTYLLKTTYTFDVSVSELFGWYLGGGRLAILEPGGEKDPLTILDWNERIGVTHINFVPSMFGVFLEILDTRKVTQLSNLKYIFLAGEALAPNLVTRFNQFKTGIILENIYGPTENTIYASQYSLLTWQGVGSIPIGKPLNNIRSYILNSNDQLQPIGVWGELCIGGEGLARGYLNRPELTAEKFDHDLWDYQDYQDKRKKVPGKNDRQSCNHAAMQPCNHATMQSGIHASVHYPITPIPHSPIYRTGDLARWLADGNIEFLGRIDHQVKIRGFRIELGEIENQLLKHNEIREAVLLTGEDEKGDRYLSAYIVPALSPSSEAFDVAGLRNDILKFLPGYMIPTYFVEVDDIPLTPTGKIDRSALPAVEIGPGEKYIAPRDEVESRLADIWEEVLLLSVPIGIDDHFFQLGGHSLKAVTLLSKIHQAFHVKLPLAEIFKRPTIRRLSQYIRDAVDERYMSIEAAEKKEYCALSSAQKRLYFLQQMDAASTVYNIATVWGLEGVLDKDRLENTFQELIQRHESLRTSFETVEVEPVQRIHDQVEFEIEYKEVEVKVEVEEEEQKTDDRRLTTEEKRQTTEGKPGTHHSSKNRIIQHSFVRPFDLSQAPLFRVGLTEVEEEKHLLMVDMHHIISDGMSTESLVQDFMALYSEEELPVMRLQYKDFSEWWNREQQRESIKQQEDFWVSEFEGEIPILELPVDFPRPSVQSFEGSSISFEIAQETTDALEALTLETGVTLYMMFLAIYNMFLAKLTNQEDIVVGSPVAGRRHADLEKIIGMFVNTLTLRNYPSGEKTFFGFLHEVKEKALGAFENQDYQYEDLVEQVNVNRDISRNPLFDTMFAMQNFDLPGIEIPGLKLKPYKHENRIAKFDLTLSVSELEGNLSFAFEYCTKLFKEGTIGRFIRYFRKTVSTVLDKPDVKLSEIEIISGEEKQQKLFDFNDTDAEYPKDKVIHQLFEEQVERIPDQIALIGQIPNKNVSLTYKELNERSGQLACLLKEKGVKPDTAAALMIERSIEMIVGILGILKAGGAYLPIDPQYPEERKQCMLKDSGAKIILTRQEIAGLSSPEAFNNSPKGTPSFGIFNRLGVPLPLEFGISPRQGGHLAYIIYTSGTTGKPKGVMIQHCNVVRLMFNDKFQFDFNNTDVWTMFHSYCFDFSVWEMYGALLYGGKLVLIPKTTARDSQRYLEVLKEKKVTILNQTPSAFYNLMNLELQNPGKELHIRWVIFGGEALTPVRLKAWKAKYPGTQLINMYGITETTVHVTFKEIEDKEIASTASSIGKPIPTLSTYVLDKALKLLPIGVPGELCVGGKGVGRGYLNQPELTGDKFINNPYIPGERLYRSGDLVKMSARGDMEYLGRMDHQVKIRGFRIELAEIESQLLSHGEVEDVVVIVKENNVGDKHLCAYVASHKDGLTAPGLREYLLKKLPGYMVPSFFIFLEGIPLTPNGKVDRKALPLPEIEVRKSSAAPRGRVEKKLAEIWSGVLGIEKEKIGTDDNFFHLGGHSLKAALLAARVRKELAVNVPLPQIFKTSSIRGLAAYIKKSVKEEYISIESVEKKEYYSLSPAQKRLYILQQLDEQGIGIAYNIPSVFRLEGNIDKDRLEDTFRQLIKRHESLRTSFHLVNDEPVQKVEEEVKEEEGTGGLAPLSKEPATRNPQPATALISSFIRPFDLSRAPLLRVALIRITDRKHILMVDMHHIITDGTSTGIFVKDFMSLYRGEKLPSLRVQYKEFSRWQKSGGVKAWLKEQEEYWLREFQGEIPVLDLPIDYARPPVQGFEGNTRGFELNKEETGKLKTLAREQDITLFMLLFCVYTVFLAKLSGREDIVVGTPAAGRRHPDLELIIGMFVNTLALRNFPASRKTFGQFLREVKERTLASFENQDYPFEELVEQVDVNRDTSRNPLFDTMFVLQNTDTTDIDIPGLKLSPYKHENKTSKFDLTLSGSEVEEKLLFTFEYSTKLFKESTIGRFIRYFRKTLYNVLEKPYIPLSGIEIISGEEKQQILFEFNDTQADYPQNKTIHELFEEQTDHTPDGVAVVESHELLEGQKGKESQVHITYGVLNEKAGRLAYVLKGKGVLADDIIGIKVKRSVEMIVGILGILKAGGAYLPIDPELSGERIKYMLSDSNANVLVTSRTLAEEVKKFRSLEVKGGFQTIFLDSYEFSNSSSYHLPNFSSSHSSNLAYVIYTSGSTGKPKGVPVEHSSVVNLACCQGKQFDIDERDRILQFSSICFDASVEQIFIAFFNGAALVMVNKNTLPDHIKFEEFMICQSITHLHAVPSFLNGLQLKDTYKYGLKRIVSGGDVCPVGLAERWSADYDFYNEYGPTETTITSIEISIEAVDKRIPRLPVGKPISNTRVYVLDKRMNLVPTGVVGELYIGGAGVARGYLNRPELTAEKFISAPTSSRKPQPEGTKKVTDKRIEEGDFHLTLNTKHVKLYRTGDLARWLPDGNIEFLGRLDHQVKIRGFRIELGEIENQLLKHAAIKEAVVLVKEDGTGDKHLCAYIVSDKDYDVLDLQEYLSLELPDYMVPSYFVSLQRLPLTPSGKTDRKTLPLTEIEVRKTSAAPRGRVEKKLAKIWSGVLGIEKEKIGIDDNFFHLGGHSLKAALLAARVRKELAVNVPLPQIFKTSSIRGLAAYIKESVKEEYISIEPVEKKEYYSLSPAQKRLYILQQLDEQGIGIAYNTPSVFRLEGNIDKDRLEDTFRQLIKRHESLRTFFHVVHEEPVQGIEEEVKVEVKEEEGTGGLAPLSKEPATALISSFIRPFDLSRAPLLRAALIKIADRKHILMVDMHHIITDGTSTGIFVKDFMSLYRGEKLPSLRIQYKEFSGWQKSREAKKSLKEQEEYWLREFPGEIPVLNLPFDYARPPVQEFEGKTVRFEVDKEETRELKTLARERDVTLFMLLLCVYTVFLAKLSGQEDIVVGTPVEGRRHADLRNIIGMFVNTLVLRNFPDGEKTYTAFLDEVKGKALDAFDNQNFQYEDLVERVNVHRDTSRNPLFDTLLAMQNIDAVELEIPGVTLKPYDHESRIAKFDLSLYAVEFSEKLIFSMEYNTKLFKRETIERFANYFKVTASGVLNNKDAILANVEIIPRQEKYRILHHFNDTAVDYPRDKTLQQLFEEQVKRAPDRIAVTGPSMLSTKKVSLQLTYRELNEKSNQLARALKHKGAMPDTLVALIADRSIDILTGIWGILKAGGAYIPLDPTYPPERIKYILKDSSTTVIVTTENLEDFAGEGYEVVKLGDSRLYKGEAYNLETLMTSNHLAYAIYTSGSTGKPKGVMIQHRPVSNFIKGITDIIDFKTGDTILSLTTISFDIFGLETILPLTRGSKIIIGNMEEQVNAEETAQTIVKRGVTILQVTPSRLLMLVSHEASMVCLKKLEYLLVGGEAFPEQLLEKTRELGVRKIYNMYGPTETTIWSAVKNVSVGEDLNIGKPISNTGIYIPGKGNRIQPIGVHGELCISGDGLARGYVNRPELTAEKFDHDLWYDQDKRKKTPGKNDRQSSNHASMPTPHHPNTPIPQSPIYRTGDLARWLPDGNIEFIGRLDLQVKIRGFRIELGEIENRLLQHEEIVEAVVLAKQVNDGEYQLHAYIVSGRVFTISEIKVFLAGELPDYMLPFHFAQVDEIPLTPNGKVDRKVLETYVTEVGTGVEYVAPRNSFEEQITRLWQEELNVEKISIYDNFFELGGNSMNIIKISNRLKCLTGETISVMTMFRYPTIHLLSQYASEEKMQATFSDDRIEESVQMMEDAMLMFMGDDNE